LRFVEKPGEGTIVPASADRHKHKKNAELHALQLRKAHAVDKAEANKRHSELQHQNSNLRDSLRKKKHSEEELEVMHEGGEFL